MSYFKKAKIGDIVYGIIFGKGKITDVYEDSHYVIMVTFDNGYEVPFTSEGIPGWGNFKKQTCFYKNDIDLDKVDYSPSDKVLSYKRIIKYKENAKLQVRVPSGAWVNVKKCPLEYIENICENESYHLFRKKIKNKK